MLMLLSYSYKLNSTLFNRVSIEGAEVGAGTGAGAGRGVAEAANNNQCFHSFLFNATNIKEKGLLCSHVQSPIASGVTFILPTYVLNTMLAC